MNKLSVHRPGKSRQPGLWRRSKIQHNIRNAGKTAFDGLGIREQAPAHLPAYGKPHARRTQPQSHLCSFPQSVSSNTFHLAGRHRFLAPLARSRCGVRDHELTVLPGGGWRSRLTGARLIGLDRREQFRSRIGEPLLASQDTDADQCGQAPAAGHRREPGSTQGDRGEGTSAG